MKCKIFLFVLDVSLSRSILMHVAANFYLKWVHFVLYAPQNRKYSSNM